MAEAGEADTVVVAYFGRLVRSLVVQAEVVELPPGYARLADGRLKPDKHAAAVTEAFRLHETGAAIEQVRDHLAGQDVKRSCHGVQALLESRIVPGELHLGTLVNEHANPAIVERDVWRRVHRISVPRGR